MVFTGGPAAGKTAILDVIQRHLDDEVAVVPESASILFRGGFPRPKDRPGVRFVQQAIFAVQRNLEELYRHTRPDTPHVCDRGALDGAAYWPGGLEGFLGAMGTTLESEYRRYDAVIFLETAAYDVKSYPVDNPLRVESPAQARRVDTLLRRVWEKHPHFRLIKHTRDFYEKVAQCLIELHRALEMDVHTKARWAPRQRKPSR